MTTADPKLTWFQCLYAWVIFGVIVSGAWVLGLNSAKTRYENDILPSSPSGAAEGQAACRRPYLVALCAYSLVATWFYAAFAVVVLLIWCTFLQMTKDKIDLNFWRWLVENLADPLVVLHTFHEQFAWTHFIISVVALAAAGWIVGFYITDEDLVGNAENNPADANSPCYRKTLRCLSVIPAIMGVVYVIFAIAQVLKSY